MERVVEGLNLKFVGDVPITAELLQGDQKTSSAKPEGFVTTPLDFIVNKTKQILSQPSQDVSQRVEEPRRSKKIVNWENEEKSYYESDEYKQAINKEVPVQHVLLLGDEASGKNEFVEKIVLPKVTYAIPRSTFSTSSGGKKGQRDTPAFARKMLPKGLDLQTINVNERGFNGTIAMCNIQPPVVNELITAFCKYCGHVIIFVDVTANDATAQLQKHLKIVAKSGKTVSVYIIGTQAEQPHKLNEEVIKKAVVGNSDYDIPFSYAEVHLSNLKKSTKFFQDMLSSIVKSKGNAGDDKDNCSVL